MRRTRSTSISTSASTLPSSARSWATPAPCPCPASGVPLDSERAEELSNVISVGRQPKVRAIGGLGVAGAKGIRRDHVHERRQHRDQSSPHVRRRHPAGEKEDGRSIGVSLVHDGELAAGDAHAPFVDPGHACPLAIASITRTARTTSRTSCTRTTCAPRATIHATAPIVPSTRWSSGSRGSRR